MLEESLDFLRELEKLKLVERQNMVLGNIRRENSAEHSWSAAMFALVLAPYIAIEPVDYDKVIRMLLIHDIVEIDAGDVSLYDEAGRAAVKTEEGRAAVRIFTVLPSPQGEDLLALWREFEACESNEAKVAKAMDAFQPVINYLLIGSRYQGNVITVEQVISKKKILREVSPVLWDAFIKMITESVEEGLYQKDNQEKA